MGEYVDVLGHPTWVHRGSGSGETVLLLHGGMSCSDDLLNVLEEPLARSFSVAAFDRRGHGRTRDSEAPFHYADMAREVAAVVEHLGAPVHLVGWSDGGIAALLVARERPDLVARQVLIGTNFHHDGVVADLPEGQSALGAAMQRAYEERSPDGPDHFAVVEAKFEEMSRSEPTMGVEDLRTVAAPTLVLAGDDDVIRLDHTAALFEALPHAQLAIVPGASHAVPMEKPDLVARLIADFLRAPVPPETALPVRRASPAPAPQESVDQAASNH